MAKGTKTGGGSRKGVPNKATADVRAAMAQLAQNTIGDIEKWIRRGARRDPLKAATVLASLFEYHIPRLQRTEHTGEGGGPIVMVQASPEDAGI